MNAPSLFPQKSCRADCRWIPETGIITGSLAGAGEYTFKVAAKNSAGKAETEIKIICGDTLALTPPMGWNSYDAFGDNVVESEVLANARYVAEKLQPVGWDTVVVDYCWSDPGAHDNNRNARTDAPLADGHISAACCPRPIVFPPPLTAPVSNRSPMRFTRWV